MGIPDPILNCVLEVCCGAAAAEFKLAEAMIEAEVCDKKHAHKCAKWLREYFDLAPAGTLTAFKQEIARLARGANG
jgi:hypothetical protein